LPFRPSSFIATLPRLWLYLVKVCYASQRFAIYIGYPENRWLWLGFLEMPASTNRDNGPECASQFADDPHLLVLDVF